MREAVFSPVPEEQTGRVCVEDIPVPAGARAAGIEGVAQPTTKTVQLTDAQEEDQAAFHKAAELAGAKLPTLESGGSGPNWHKWIIAQTSLREAKALIEGSSRAGDGTK